MTVTKELQMVEILKMNQWKWMLANLKMQMINTYGTAEDTLICQKQLYY